jgi:hypothetical protein
MIYELSRDYVYAWNLIQQGDRLACWVDSDCEKDGRTIAFACLDIDVTWIHDNEFNYVYLLEQNTFELFVERCTELNIEFYLPLADNMLVISKERFQEVASEVVSEALAPFDVLIKSMGVNANGN